MTASIPTLELAARKAALRSAMLGRRAVLHAAHGAAAAEAVALRLLAELPPPAGAAVSAYIALGHELDPRPLVQALAARGNPILLPRLEGAGQPLALHLWRPGAPLVPGTFGLEEPSADAPRASPDVLLVPLLAFDREGNRLGYGKGYYDRTLAALRARRQVQAIGLAFAGQEVEEVPHHEGDQRLDAVVTERGAFEMREAEPQ